MHPVFFDFDKYDVREDQKSTVAANADFLTGKKHLRVIIEGYADERGSTEYNLALGESRAQTVKQMLVREGVDPDSVKVISYGKERQFCTESNEACWQQNRRAQFSHQSLAYTQVPRTLTVPGSQEISSTLLASQEK